MKAAYVCADRGVPAFGSKGCSLHLQEVSLAFAQHQIPVNLFAASFGGSCPTHLDLESVHKIRHKKLNDRALREQSDMADNACTMEALSRYGPYDLVYERYSLWSHAGMSYAQKLSVPAVLEVNAPLIEEQENYRGLIDKAGAKRISCQCFSAASHILAVSSEVADYLEGYPQARGKIHVLPNGVNVDKFRHIKPALPHEFTIGFVGTLKPWHGVEGLIESFAKLRAHYSDLRLMIVGDGPQRTVLEQRIVALGLTDCVTMTGAVSPQRVPEYLNQMDVGVAPYPADIPFYFSPLKVYEYMAAGLCIVASKIGQIETLIQDGESGLLYPPGDIEAMTRALSTLLTRPQMAKRLARRAQEEAQCKHSWHSRIDQVLHIIGQQPQGKYDGKG